MQPECLNAGSKTPGCRMHSLLILLGPQGSRIFWRTEERWTGYALIRSNLKSHSDADITAAVNYGKRLKVYLLSQVANPPETKLTDAKDGPEKAFFDKQWKLPDIEEAKW
jgi:hypothetical protein